MLSTTTVNPSSSEAQSIESAVERDTASGNGLQLATITSAGVEFETYDSPSEAT